MEITPPGDVRIAFDFDYTFINSISRKDFECEILEEDNVALINKVPSEDFMIEVIQNGAILGSIKYDVEKSKYIFMPSIEGATLLLKKGCKRKIVEVDENAKDSIMKGGSVLAPGIVELDKNIKAGDEIIITFDKKVIGVGRALISAEDIKSKGVFAKVRRRKKREPMFSFKKRTWKDVIRANKKVIENYEKEAINFIKKVREKFKNLPVAVAFSGGKDSLATLILAKKALGNIKALFIDTGFEFNETVKYVFKICNKLDIDVIYYRCNKFFEGFDYFKFVARDFRWCCKVCKLGPTAKMISENFGEALVLVGQRRYESALRAKTGRIWRNKYIKNQIAASPIQNWTALHVWLFLLKEDIEFNPLYEIGFERIGCIFCPAQDMHELNKAVEMYPDLWNRFKKRLLNFYNEGEIKKGVWRWRFSKKSKISKYRETVDVEKFKNGYLIKDLQIQDESVRKILNNLIKLKNNVEIRDNGIFIRDGEEDLREVYTILERAKNCFGCGICAVNCPSGAIKYDINDKVYIDHSKCIKCLKCNNICPIRRFKVNLIVFKVHDFSRSNDN